MFEALILVCSASITMEVDTTKCLLIKDSRGPYITQEDCDNRTSEMVNDIVQGEISYYISSVLAYPPLLYTEKRCLRKYNEYI